MGTVAQLEEYLGYEPPEGSQRALDWAEDILLGDPCVLPIDTDNSEEADALARAVCAQVEYWIEIAGGHEPDDDSVTRIDSSLDTLRPTGELDVGTARFTEMREIAPRAEAILRHNGLWTVKPDVYPKKRTFVYNT